jgi:hypothetical protein
MPINKSTKLPLIEPIVPTARPQPFNSSAWLFEPKYDGFRGMVYLTRKSCTIYSKRGNGMTRFRELAEQLRAELPRREVILDGEIVAIDDDGRINCWCAACRAPVRAAGDGGSTGLAPDVAGRWPRRCAWRNRSNHLLQVCSSLASENLM